MAAGLGTAFLVAALLTVLGVAAVLGLSRPASR
jgi:hypothetical protein